MSRPTSFLSNAEFIVPPGWISIVTAVSHRTYSQLVTCEINHGGSSQKTLFVNDGKSPDVCMLDAANGAPQLAIGPQSTAVNLNFQFYYSKDQSASGAALQAEKYKSSQLDVLITEKRPDTDFPDYVSFVILVEDVCPNQQATGPPKFDDLVVTFYCMKNSELTAAAPSHAMKDPESTTAAPSHSPDTMKNPESTIAAPSHSPYNLANIQGDILPALPKTLEYFYYFQIAHPAWFRGTFGEFIVPKITTSSELAANTSQPEPTFLGLNVGFNRVALGKFGLTDDLLDDSFVLGQQQDSKSLGDAGSQDRDNWVPNWEAEFKNDIHGIFLITAFDDAVASKFVADMEAAFHYTATRTSLKKVVLLKGSIRPGAERPNDHFGYRGGMSNPQVRGVTFQTPAQPEIRFPGTPIIPMGTIVMGYDGDEDKDRRPTWAKDGAFMVTRKLDTLVPEFDAFLLQHGPKIFPDIPVQSAADRLGARLFGRWKDGTPTELSPDAPNPEISGDDKKINNFTFDQAAGQTHCPFAAHIRKCNPRNDVSPIESAFKHLVRRHNMSYGPEVTDAERERNETINGRGLHVVCYASSIVRGFKFYQQAWFNDPNFPPNKPQVPGMDPIFGQTGEESRGVHRSMTGTNPTLQQQEMTFPQLFVSPKGGEYFFAPSISTLRDIIGKRPE